MTLCAEPRKAHASGFHAEAFTIVQCTMAGSKTIAAATASATNWLVAAAMDLEPAIAFFLYRYLPFELSGRDTYVSGFPASVKG